MKSRLKKIINFARMMGLTRNIFRFSILEGKDGDMQAFTKQIIHANPPYPCYSVSKSTTAICLGLLYDKGLFTPSDKIADYLGEFFPENVDKRWYDVTIDHLLHHRPGFVSDEGFDAGSSDLEEGPLVWSGRENLLSVFSLPIAYEPGTRFQYADINYYILGRLVEKLSGQSVLSYLSNHLFAPMGFVNYAWLCDPAGHSMGGTGLFLRTEDYAKLGWLWLHKGVYNGVRYLSEEWITMGLTALIDRTDNKHYGYGVRRLSENGYSITGAFGQGLYFNVKKDFVICWHARRRNQIMNICEIFDKLNMI